MKPGNSSEAFREFVASHGASLEQQCPRDAVNIMLDFFLTRRALGCDGNQSDMLLFQWGTYDWGSGTYFELNITRQFIEPEGEGDDAISQLSLTFKYRETAALRVIGEGNRWCESLENVGEFRKFINESPALIATENQDVTAIDLNHWYV